MSDRFYAESREAWREWLERHHTTSPGIWLVYKKPATGEPCIAHEASVEEALCFGWIDGLIRNVDEGTHVRRFTPRKGGSRWSETNKKRVQRMIDQGRMTEAGLALVRAAQKGGAWEAAAERESDAAPPDLAAALAEAPEAERFFGTLAPSHRKAYIRYITDAKREETRRRRIADVVARCAEGTKPGM